MEPPIPLKGVVLFIAFGTMVFIIVFCFIKRQITRFTLRSSHGPHAVIGANAPKSLKADIERKLKRVKEISCEPHLLTDAVEMKLSDAIAADESHYVYRMKAVDLLSVLDAELKQCGMPLIRKPTTPLKLFLLDARQNGRPLEGSRLDLVEKFANSYEHARHNSAEFTVTHYEEFKDLLQQLITHIHQQRCNQQSVDGSETQLDKQHPLAAAATVASCPTKLSSTLSKPTAVNDDSSTLSVQFTLPTSSLTDTNQSQQQRIANYRLATADTHVRL